MAMAGIDGMKVDDIAIATAKSVMSGSHPAIWATFSYDKDELFAHSIYCNKHGNEFPFVWDRFVENLDAAGNEVRYGIVDFSHTNERERVTRSKRIFVLWAPDSASTRQKLIATMHLRDVKNQLTQGTCGIVIQANCIDDLDYKTVLNRIISKTSVF